MNAVLTRQWMGIAAVAAAMLAACGGGDDADGGTGSISASTGSINKAQLDACPNTRMSPVDMSKLGCMVGSFTGRTPASQSQAAKACSMAINAQGVVTLSLEGQGTTTHQISTQADTSASMSGTSGSFYAREGLGLGLKSTGDTDGTNLAITAVHLSADAPWTVTVTYVPPGATSVANAAANAVVCTGNVS